MPELLQVKLRNNIRNDAPLFCACYVMAFYFCFAAFSVQSRSVSHTPSQLTASDLKELKKKSGMLIDKGNGDNDLDEQEKMVLNVPKRVEYDRDLTTRQQQQATMQHERHHQNLQNQQQQQQQQRLGSAGRRTLGAFEVLDDKS